MTNKNAIDIIIGMITAAIPAFLYIKSLRETIRKKHETQNSLLLISKLSIASLQIDCINNYNSNFFRYKHNIALAINYVYIFLKEHHPLTNNDYTDFVYVHIAEKVSKEDYDTIADLVLNKWDADDPVLKGSRLDSLLGEDKNIYRSAKHGASIGYMDAECFRANKMPKNLVRIAREEPPMRFGEAMYEHH